MKRSYRTKVLSSLEEAVLVKNVGVELKRSKLELGNTYEGVKRVGRGVVTRVLSEEVEKEVTGGSCTSRAKCRGRNAGDGRAKERRKIEVIIQSWQLSTLRRRDRLVVAATGLSLHVFRGWRVVGRAFAILRLGPGGEIGGSE